jgi:hypothetical protein
MTKISVGDIVYCRRYPDKKIAYGEIRSIHEVNPDPFISIVDEITGQFRIALIADIEEPTVKVIAEKNSAINRKIISAERRKEAQKGDRRKKTQKGDRRKKTQKGR